MNNYILDEAQYSALIISKLEVYYKVVKDKLLAKEMPDFFAYNQSLRFINRFGKNELI